MAKVVQASFACALFVTATTVAGLPATTGPPPLDDFPSEPTLARHLSANCALENSPNATNRLGQGCDHFELTVADCGQRQHDDADFIACRCTACCSKHFCSQAPGRALEEVLAELPANTTEIKLTNQRLVGLIPDDLAQRFPKLRSLDLSYNWLSGSLPAGLGALSSLEYLHLFYNQLQGEIPAALGNATELRHVILGGNDFTSLPREVGRWHELTHISCAACKLMGELPREVGNWRKVQSVYLSGMAGEIPREVGNWHEVRYVRFMRVGFTGSLPREIGNWRKVIEVRFEGTKQLLSGVIPEEVGNWEEVMSVFFIQTLLEGPLPSTVGNWKNVMQVGFFHGRLTGPIPKEVGNWSKVMVCYLQNLRLTGSLPTELGNWGNVMMVSLSENSLSGSLPEELGSWRHVSSVNLGRNHFTGPIPSSVGNWTKVSTVQLEGNSLEGSLPSGMENWQYVQHVNMGENSLTGPLPRGIGAWRQLKRLLLSGNHFTGMLPHSHGNWAKLTELRLAGSALTGPIHPDAGLWHSLQLLDLSGNDFTGPVPEGLGNWSEATHINLAYNRLTYLPKAVNSLSKLEVLSMQENRLEGVLPDLGRLAALKELSLQGNALVSTGTLPTKLVNLDLSRNRLRSLPPALDNLGELDALDLSNNKISRWPARGVWPIKEDAKVALALTDDSHKPFSWTRLQKLDVSGNFLGEPTYNTVVNGYAGSSVPSVEVFIASLAHLHSLNYLACKGCNLTGVLPAGQLGGLADVTLCAEKQSRTSCSGWYLARGFKGLQVLDLSENAISVMAAAPSQALQRANFSKNALESLDAAWLNLEAQNQMRELSISGNPRLRMPVQSSSARCSGSSNLTTNPGSYLSHDATSQCASLCRGPITGYIADTELNEVALCRCKAGHGGQGRNCSVCGLDAYSFFADEDPLGRFRTCRHCPAGSDTQGKVQVEGISGCKCPLGTFLDVSASTCAKCTQWPYRSTKARGETQASACGCNTSYSGLKEFAGVCGCDDGFHMNHQSLTCEKCSNTEDCIWGTNLSASLQPPIVKAGFWPEPVAGLASFARNNIWRCTSAESCLEGGTCAEGRHGLACGLCQPGWHGAADGPCVPCDGDFSMEDRWSVLVLAAVASGVPAVVLLHMSLTGASDAFGLLMQLRAVRGSLKQMVKHLQTVTIIGGLSVTWPPLALSVFQVLDQLTFSLPILLAAGCLTEETSAGFEMAAKWSMPAAFVIIAVLAVPVSVACAMILRGLARRSSFLSSRLLLMADNIAMTPADVARVLLFSLTLFWSTLVANSLEVLTCIPSPNGALTVATYPHVACDFSKWEYSILAVPSLLMVLFCVVLPLLLLIRISWKSTVRLASTMRDDRGWFAFLFEDFRDGRLFELVIIMGKDALFVLIPAALPGEGAAQLLIVAATSAAYGCWVMWSAPFHDRSNTLLEAWNAASAAAVCVYSVGMGYEQTAGMEDVAELFEEGKKDPTYRGRAVGMFVVQAVTIAVPSFVLLFQLLCAVQRTRRLLPRRVQPVTPEESELWLDGFLQVSGIGASSEVAGLLKDMDETDRHTFRTLVQQTSAAIGKGFSKRSFSHLVNLSNRFARDESQELKEKQATAEASEDEAATMCEGASVSSPTECKGTAAEEVAGPESNLQEEETAEAGLTLEPSPRGLGRASL